MMNYECLLYGVKGLLFGLPLAFLLNFAIYHSLLGAMDVGFQIPWGSVAIVGGGGGGGGGGGLWLYLTA